jgi:hypothetical protein
MFAALFLVSILLRGTRVMNRPSSGSIRRFNLQ